MKPFEQSALTVGALLASNSSPLERMRWDLRWVTNRFAEWQAVRVYSKGHPPLNTKGSHSESIRTVLQTSSRTVQFRLITGKDLVQ